MTAVPRRPDVYIEEVESTARPITGVGTSITGFLGVAQKGPVSVPQAVLSIDDFRRIYGDNLQYQALGYAVEGFFKNGGIECWVSRLAHYTDPADLGTQGGTAADYDADGVGSDTFASYTGDASITSVAMANGWLLEFDINNTGAVSAEFKADAIVVTGVGGAFGLGVATDTADYRINDGPLKSIDLNGVTAGVANFVNALNAQLEGVSVQDDGGGQLQITTDRKGLSAKIELLNFGATFAATTGLSAGVTDNSTDTVNNNVDNIEAVTFAEIESVIETAVAGLAVSQNTTGQIVLTVTSGIAGPTSEIDLTATSTAALVTALGLTGLGTQGGGAAAVGATTAPVPAFTFKSGYRGYESPGLFGNDLSVEIVDDPKYVSTGLGLDLASDVSLGATQILMTSITGVGVGSILKIEEGATVEYVKVQKTTTAVSGSGVTFTVDLTAPLANGFTAAGSTINSQEHTITVYKAGEALESPWEQLSVNPDVDNYVLTVLNDSETGSNYILAEDIGVAFPANVLLATSGDQALTGGTAEAVGLVNADLVGDSGAKTGRYAFDDVETLNLIAAPPTFGSFPGGTPNVQANTVVQNALLEYAGGRMDLFAILDCPDDLTPTQAKNYRNNTLGADSKWGALYYPHLEVPDPLGVGNNPTVYVPPSGHVAGLYARVDNIPPPAGGIATAPAGIDQFGKLFNVVGLKYLAGDADHDLLNPAGINAIRRFSQGGPAAPGIVVMGARTLSNDPRWRYVQVRRLMTYIEQSIKQGTRFAIFRNNDFRLWSRLTDLISKFLRGLHQAGQLRGEKAADAYFVRIDASTTDNAAIDAGKLIGEIGIAPQKPAEFIIFRFSQFQAGSELEEG